MIGFLQVDLITLINHLILKFYREYSKWKINFLILNISINIVKKNKNI